MARALTQATQDTAIANGVTAGAFSWAASKTHVMLINYSGADCMYNFCESHDTLTAATATASDYYLASGNAVMVEASDFGLANIGKVSCWMVSGGTDASATFAAR